MNSQSKLIIVFIIQLLITPLIPTLTRAAANAPNVQTLQGAANLHLPFVQNKGQVADPDVAYVADTFACQVRVTKDGQIVYRLPEKEAAGHQPPEIRELMTGATVHVHGIDKQSTTVSYYSGRDASKWKTHLPSYARVGVGYTANGVRLELKAHSHNVEKLFFVEPGADPSEISMRVQGAKKLQVNGQGELELTTASGVMRLTNPVAYQQIDSSRRQVPVRYQVDQNSYGFILGAYDKSRELVIDPLVKVWHISSVTEGLESIDTAIMTLAADDQGNVYAAGYANSQLIIYKLDRRLENVLNSTFIDCRGSYFLSIRGMALDDNGDLFIAGITHCTTFPITDGAPDSRLSEDDEGSSSSLYHEGFVAKYSANLELLHSTFIGGDYQEKIFALALNSEGKVYVAGYSEAAPTDSQHFYIPPGAYDVVPGPYYQKKAFVVRLDNDLSKIEAATYLGGSADGSNGESEDVAHCIAIDRQGNVWVAGRTTHPDFPVTTNSLDTSYNGKGDLFLAKLDPNLKQPPYIATYIGGSKDEAPTDMLFDSQGNIYLLGWTFSSDFPMGDGGGFDTSYGNDEEDGFILKLNAQVDEIMAATYLGGEDEDVYGDDVPAAMVLSDDGSMLMVVGRSESRSFPTTSECIRPSSMVDTGSPSNARFPATHNRDTNGDFGFGDGFLTVLPSNLRGELLFSTFIGTESCEYFDDIILNGEDYLVAGKTESGGFPLAPYSDTKSRGLVLRFNEHEIPEEPAPSISSGGGRGGGGSGGGGGGCFIATCW